MKLMLKSCVECDPIVLQGTQQKVLKKLCQKQWYDIIDETGENNFVYEDAKEDFHEDYINEVKDFYLWMKNTPKLSLEEIINKYNKTLSFIEECVMIEWD